MIINALTSTATEGIIRFDERYATPITISRIDEQSGAGYLSLFINRNSTLSENIASVVVTLSPASSSSSAQQLSIIPGQRFSVAQTIQTAQAQAFRTASATAALAIMTARFAADTFRNSLGTAFVDYVSATIPASAVKNKTKAQFYEDVFLRGVDPGNSEAKRRIDSVVGTSVITLDQSPVSAISELPEWLLVSVSSYDGAGVYIGKDVVRVSKKTLLLDYDITRQRTKLPPSVAAQYDGRGFVSLVAKSSSPAKLYAINLDPGSLLQDNGGAIATYAGQTNGASTVSFVSNHLAQSQENIVVYRAVDMLGRFDGAVVGGKTNLSCMQASLSLSRVADGVLVELLNVPANTINVRIYRSSNTIDQEFGEQVGTLLHSRQTTGTPVDVAITDRLDQSISAVARSMYYTYYAVCIDNRGNETRTRTATVLIDPSSVAVGFAKPVIDGLATRFVQQTNTFDLSFQLGFDITQETTTSELVKLLAAQGLIQYYSDDIDPKKLAELVTAKATLRDMITGEEIFLGVFGQGSSVGYSGLKPSYYKLELITTVRNPQTSLDLFVATGYSTPRPGNSCLVPFQYVPSITLSPTALLTGTVSPSGSFGSPTKTYERYTGIGALTGFFVDAAYVPIDMMTASKPLITQKQLVGNSITPTLERISWQIDKPNTASSVSHFVIWRDGECRGVVAGSAAINGTYQFYDTPANASSNGTYSVAGWLFDGTLLGGSDTTT